MGLQLAIQTGNLNQQLGTPNSLFPNQNINNVNVNNTAAAANSLNPINNANQSNSGGSVNSSGNDGPSPSKRSRNDFTSPLGAAAASAAVAANGLRNVSSQMPGGPMTSMAATLGLNQAQIGLHAAQQAQQAQQQAQNLAISQANLIQNNPVALHGALGLPPQIPFDTTVGAGLGGVQSQMGVNGLLNNPLQGLGNLTSPNSLVNMASLGSTQPNMSSTPQGSIEQTLQSQNSNSIQIHENGSSPSNLQPITENNNNNQEQNNNNANVNTTESSELNTAINGTLSENFQPSTS